MLRITAGRLVLDRHGVAVLDLPLPELHSVSPAGVGTAMDVWHGPHRLRFAFRPGSDEAGLLDGYSVDADPTLLGDATDVAMGLWSRTSRRRRVAAGWVAALQWRVGPRPPGVRVRAPVGPVTYGALVALAWTAVVAVVLVAVTVIARAVW